MEGPKWRKRVGLFWSELIVMSNLRGMCHIPITPPSPAADPAPPPLRSPPGGLVSNLSPYEKKMGRKGKGAKNDGNLGLRFGTPLLSTMAAIIITMTIDKEQVPFCADFHDRVASFRSGCNSNNP